MKSWLRVISGLLGRKPEQPMKKYASAHRFPDRFVLHSELQTPFGMFASDPFLPLPLDVSPADLAAAILSVLDASRRADDTPHGKELSRWYVQQMGVKSIAALQRNVLCVSIQQTESTIEFAPTHNGGTSGDKKGFQPNGNPPVPVPAGAPPDQLAAAFHKAISLCTTIYP